MYKVKTASRYKQLTEKKRPLKKKSDAWERVRGVLPKKTTGLAYQRRERKSWL